MTTEVLFLGDCRFKSDNDNSCLSACLAVLSLTCWHTEKTMNAKECFSEL